MRPWPLLALSLACACALATVPTQRLFPVLTPADPAQARLPDGWTVSVKGDLATGKVNLTRAGGTLSALVEVRNDASELPLRTAKVVAYDKEKTLLQSAPLPDPADGYQDTPVAKTFTNRGLASFSVADRAPPFTVELTLTDGKREEKLSFPFKEFGPDEFWADPGLVMTDPGVFFRTLSFAERQGAYNTARKSRQDAEGYRRMKAGDPKRYELMEWVRLHEYDIEF